VGGGFAQPTIADRWVPQSQTPLRVKVTDDGQVIDIDLPKELPH
jgi:hypothetical protein